ncbi:MAG: thymidine phosphorylase [Chloroflexi bacterium HGW-Chloroflexi-10]|nr:MAG: thymidine phosphorylase [Chloroflexi bacterium HGW-Chloroflexi-10]
MKAVDIIIKKREHKELSKEEIEFFVQGFVKGVIPDYQASAWAMAVLLNGMSDRETTDLTIAMAYSGETMDLSQVVEVCLDKHSTGGVGDKTTLVVEPLVAACGLPFGKMSGRGLGFSGGTLDKMESIPGYRVDLSRAEFIRQLKEIGIVLSGQSTDLAPADGKMYALRDVTGTVPSMPLIASSIMSKKIAGGAQAMVLDVKVGVGAFMTTLEEARQLARLMVSIAALSGRKAVCMLSDMNQPLGNAVGNSLELLEAIDTLHGGGPGDFVEHCLAAAAYLVVLGKGAKNLAQGREMVETVLKNGKAWETFRKLVIAQGGDVRTIDNPDLLPKAPFIETVVATTSGYLKEVNAREIGETSVDLGAGRIKKGDPIDYSVGVLIHHKVGEFVVAGEPLFTVHANAMDKLLVAKRRIKQAHIIQDEFCEPLPLFYEIVE